MPSSTPARAEALNEIIAFEYDGETYEIESAKDWDLDVLEAYEDGKIVTVVKAVLGKEQYAKFKTKRRTVTDLGSLFDSLQIAIGVQGN